MKNGQYITLICVFLLGWFLSSRSKQEIFNGRQSPGTRVNCPTLCEKGCVRDNATCQSQRHACYMNGHCN